jgi:hypothetical protein
VPFIGVPRLHEVSFVSEWMSGGTVLAFLFTNPDHDRAELVHPTLGRESSGWLTSSPEGGRHHCGCGIHAFARRGSWRLEDGRSSTDFVLFLLASPSAPLGKRACRLSGPGPADRLWAREHTYCNRDHVHRSRNSSVHGSRIA